MRPRDASQAAAVVPAQLQSTARELQAAIQSARRRRTSTEPSQAPPKSWSTHDSADDEADKDKENASLIRNAETTDGLLGHLSKDVDGTLASNHDLNEDEDRGDALALSQLSGLSGLSAFDSDDSDAWSIGHRDTPATEDNREGTVLVQQPLVSDPLQKGAREALCWMQRDVEQQARANKAANACLVRAVGDITDVIASAIPESAARLSNIHAMMETDHVVAADLVMEAVAQWKAVVSDWQQQVMEKKQELAQRLAEFRNECESRLQVLEVAHQGDCEQLQRLLDCAQEKAEARENFHEDERRKLCCLIEEANTSVERFQCQNEDLAAYALRLAAQSNIQSTPLSSSAPSSEFNHRIRTHELLSMTARIKEADLRTLQWRMAFEDQVAVSSRTEERLQMLLEDQRVREEVAKRSIARMVPRQSIEAYQQRISWLEDHVSDMQSQIACDREEFSYEMSKWELEKQGVKSELEEVRSMSVRLLKMLLIREKLQKKRERKHTNRLESIQSKLEASKSELKSLLQTLMQESAALLLVVQQLAVQAVALPVKPAQVRSMVKQLKRLDRALDKVEVISAADVTEEEAAVSFSVDSTANEVSFGVDGAGSPCNNDCEA